MVVTADISSSSGSDILQQSSPCPADHQVVDLVFVSSNEGGPDELEDFIVWEDFSSDAAPPPPPPKGGRQPGDAPLHSIAPAR